MKRDISQNRPGQGHCTTFCPYMGILSFFINLKLNKLFFSLFPQLKQPNTDWTLTKNQNSSIKRYSILLTFELYLPNTTLFSVIIGWYLLCSYNSINMDGTLMRKAMHADPENYVTSMAPGQYWTWGTHMRGMKGKRPNTVQRKQLSS